MPESFDAYDYAGYLGHRWKTIALTCAVACAVAAGVSLLLTTKYTATCRIVIEPPAASDQRAAQAVSPIYLESLRTYEHFAASDNLFQNALDRFRLRAPGQRRSIEDWKRSILKVEIPRNTKILSINVTLPDPKKAQLLALYLAEETVKLNRTMNRASDQELMDEARQQYEEARARLGRAESASGRAIEGEPTAALAAENESAEELLAEVERDLLAAGMQLAEDSDREKYLAASAESKSQLDAVRAEMRFARARAESLRAKRAELQADIARRQALLAQRTVRRDALLAERKDAQTNFEAMEARVREIQAATGFRGERLSIVDPGIVPERPSSPNVPFNVVAAFLAGLAGSALYLTVAFGYERHRMAPPASVREMSRDRDD
jgi:capsular polysaccharide biosynthesis protein